jgi:RNA polymerase sigma factor (sigma-70 family)
MAADRAGSLIEHLRKTVLRQDQGSLSDAQVLDRFITQRDEAAFETLVQRHAGMVWGVCRRLLHNAHDAEDAFQASFLVLARKAASVSPRDKVANWLYGVAYQTAVRARAIAARRNAREKQVQDMPEPTTVDAALWDQLRPILDQELAALPERYREVVIQCDLEGHTRGAVAGRLKIPEGTVASRLATARKLLAKRLARHGLVVSSGSLAAVLSENVTTAGVPPTVVSATVHAVTAFTMREMADAISANVATLTEGVLKAMLITKLKTMTTLVLLFGAVALGGGMLAHGPAIAQQGAPAPEARAQDNAQPGPKPVPVRPDDAPLRGEWIGKDRDGVRLSLIFAPKNAIRVITESGRDKHGTYSVDWHRKPYHLDVTWEGSSTAGKAVVPTPDGPVAFSRTYSASTTVRTIMELTDGRLRIEDVDPSGERPQKFTASALVLTKKEQPPDDGKLAAIQADRDLAVAESYRQTGHFGSARFYYELVRHRYPKTEYATKATQQLTGLEKLRIRLADGSEVWVEPATDSVGIVSREGDSSATPMTVILANAKIIIAPHTRTKWTVVKTAPGDCVRLEAPGITVEVPHLTIERGEWLSKVEAVDGTVMFTNYRRAAPKAAATIGRIILVGNNKTPDEAILKLLQLLPGEAVNPETLRRARERLATLRAVITVIDTDQTNIRDILVRVEE